MYLDFYALKQAPFHITPDPQFLFLSPTHKAALEAMVHGMWTRQGLIAIFGEAGMGKTTLLRAYLAHANAQELQTIFVVNVHLTWHALLGVIARELGLSPTAAAPHLLLADIQQALREVHGQGRHVALIIDEAQALPVETLQHLWQLANLEVDAVRPLQVVLLGQPELAAKLQQEALRPLEQRMLVRATLAPLSRQESLEYMRHRLAKVMTDEQPIFTPQALRDIASCARGIPRVMNVLCTNALLAGCAARRKPIPAAVVQQVIAAQHGKRSGLPWQAGIAAAAVVVLGVGLTWFASWQGAPRPPLEATSETALEALVPATPMRPAEQQEAVTTALEVLPTEDTAMAPPSAPPSSVPPVLERPVTPVPPQPLEKAEGPREQLDTQAMQDLVTRLVHKKRPVPELDSRAMQRLLVRLETTEKTTVTGGSRAKATRKRNP